MLAVSPRTLKRRSLSIASATCSRSTMQSTDRPTRRDKDADAAISATDTHATATSSVANTDGNRFSFPLTRRAGRIFAALVTAFQATSIALVPCVIATADHSCHLWEHRSWLRLSGPKVRYVRSIRLIRRTG